MAGDSSTYEWRKYENGKVKISGLDGIEWLMGIEELKFDDKVVVLDPEDSDPEDSDPEDSDPEDSDPEDSDPEDSDPEPSPSDNDVFIVQRGICGCGKGDDTYILARQLIDTNAEIIIFDTEGSNTVQLVDDDLGIAGASFDQSGIIFELKNGAKITIVAADTMTFSRGGDPLKGVPGTSESYQSFVKDFFKAVPEPKPQTFELVTIGDLLPSDVQFIGVDDKIDIPQSL